MKERKQDELLESANRFQREFYNQNPSCENSISWVIKELGNQRHATEDPYMFDDESADNDIKYCPVCDYCWEKPRSGKSRRTLITYRNFPRFGKKKMRCPHCRGELNLDFLCKF